MNPFLDSLGYEPPMIKEVHYYVLDDTMNDALFVEPVFILHWCHLQDHGCSPKSTLYRAMGSSSSRELGVHFSVSFIDL
jgi:hypothetical protein